MVIKHQINQGNSVELNISQANNTLQNPNDTTGAPVFNISTLATSVIVNSGDVLVLGGLTQNQRQHSNTRIPILGHLPFVGLAFQDNSRTHNKKQLMIFLRPKILYTPEDAARVTGTKYNFSRNTQLDTMRHMHYNPNYKDYWVSLGLIGLNPFLARYLLPFERWHWR